MKSNAVSLATTIAITGLSRRTWWRRISAAAVQRLGNDSRGRTMLCWADVLPRICIPMDAEDHALVFRADQGDAGAQNDIGQLFFVAEKYDIAHYWLQQAVGQGHADAMQWLACCYVAGRGVPKDEHLALMWLAKAAAHGSAIARGRCRGCARVDWHAGMRAMAPVGPRLCAPFLSHRSTSAAECPVRSLA